MYLQKKVVVKKCFVFHETFSVLYSLFSNTQHHARTIHITSTLTYSHNQLVRCCAQGKSPPCLTALVDSNRRTLLQVSIYCLYLCLYLYLYLYLYLHL